MGGGLGHVGRANACSPVNRKLRPQPELPTLKPTVIRHVSRKLSVTARRR